MEQDGNNFCGDGSETGRPGQVGTDIKCAGTGGKSWVYFVSMQASTTDK